MGEYDKIIKENLEAIFLTLAEKYLGFSIKKSKKIEAKLQWTLEREPDFVSIIETGEGERFILHLEFQVTNEKGMVYRNAEYKALLQRKYQLPVRQVVIYMGQAKPTMPTELPPDQVISGFRLQNIRDYDHQNLLASNIPEEILLAILANFKKEKPENVIRLILQRLLETSGDQIKFQKYIKQLSTLSRLRKLDEETIKQVEAMPITYDITQDYLYKRGEMEGEKKGEKRGEIKGEKRGEKRGEMKGKLEQQTESILKLHKNAGFSAEQIAQYLELPLEQVREIIHGK